MKEVIFVYAGDPNNNSQIAPFTITRNLYHFLASKFERVHYFDWFHTGDLPQVTKNTILLCHPNYPAETAARRLFKIAESVPGCVKCLIHPLHHGIPEINLPFDDLARQADVIFSITGKHWYDTLEQSPFAHWKSKMVRVDMAIDAGQFPHVKQSYAAPGHRALVYIGCDRPEKGPDALCELMRRLPYTLHCYGNIGYTALLNLSNVQYHGYAHVVPQWAKDLSTIADIFVNLSRSDANPTTILEAAAWGFAVAATKESGYYPNSIDSTSPVLAELQLENMAASVATIESLQHAVLPPLTTEARNVVISHYTWERFCTTIWNKLSQFI